MQRMSVLLPLPLGPHTTTTSPALTFRFMLLRTWSEPKPLVYIAKLDHGKKLYCHSARLQNIGTAYYMNKGILQQTGTRS